MNKTTKRDEKKRAKSDKGYVLYDRTAHENEFLLQKQVCINCDILFLKNKTEFLSLLEFAIENLLEDATTQEQVIEVEEKINKFLQYPLADLQFVSWLTSDSFTIYAGKGDNLGGKNAFTWKKLDTGKVFSIEKINQNRL